MLLIYCTITLIDNTFLFCDDVTFVMSHVMTQIACDRHVTMINVAVSHYVYESGYRRICVQVHVQLQVCYGLLTPLRRVTPVTTTSTTGDGERSINNDQRKPTNVLRYMWQGDWQ